MLKRGSFTSFVIIMTASDEIRDGGHLSGRAPQVYKESLPNYGGCTRTRTWDPLIKSQLLYQLSYAPAAGGAVYNKAAADCR